MCLELACDSQTVEQTNIVFFQVSLLIKSIGPGDEGEYTCTALNPYGEASSRNPRKNRRKNPGTHLAENPPGRSQSRYRHSSLGCEEVKFTQLSPPRPSIHDFHNPSMIFPPSLRCSSPIIFDPVSNEMSHLKSFRLFNPIMFSVFLFVFLIHFFSLHASLSILT